MSISSSLSAGVSGLNANAQKLASISDNISNSSTYGYKRSETDFHSMVVNSGNASKYTAGGVRTTTMRLIDERGQIQSTSNATDIAINGRGFLPVAPISSIGGGGDLPLSLKTTGSFRPDSAGTLVDANGYVLLGWPAEASGNFPAVPRDSADALKPINIFHNQYSSNPTTEMTMGVNLPSQDTTAGSAGASHDITMEYFGNLGQPESVKVVFTPTVPAGPGPASNEWTMTITDSATDADADGNADIVGQYRMTFNTDPTTGGTLETVTPISGGGYDADTGEILINAGGGDIRLNIGKPDEPSGITQLDTRFSPSNLSKNGSSVGSLLGVEIDDFGIVHGVYDSGFTRAIYKVPVVDVPNVNGLKSGDAQTYRVSVESGDMFLWDAGTGPTGTTAGFAREASATDVAHELTQLIQTQRAYSSSAKIIQTVDEMLQETTNLKR